MVFYIFLFSYAIVNVLADNIDLSEYITEYYITNEHMQNAFDTIDGLAFTIKRIILADEYTMEELNYMFVIPDQADIFELNKYIGYQRKMQNEIIMALHIDRPFYNRLVDLSELGDKRRELTRKALLQLLFFDLYHLNDENYTFKQKCILIGLALSTKYPTHYTKSVDVENDTVCVITDINGMTSKYKEIKRENDFYQIQNKRVYGTKRSLFEQLDLEA
ncbi:uncharacterized protein LOC126835454 isoform X2 [Adelges cooleyi]|uniref:uncharacterized protein LOC126835454 isoform X2 n=2 Tax=Adelges cooleyi TaxID=133065 RepID=UPI00217F671F|nr:uncharacterized protein LOC126835454 isoform X2 [Adelges cooleyi]